MIKSKLTSKLDESLLPQNTGYKEQMATLCIGLDFAWFGGSENDKTSQYDFLAAVVAGSDSGNGPLASSFTRVPLRERDPDAAETAKALKAVIDKFSRPVERVLVAVDAPLQTNRNLGKRLPKPKKGTVQRRACDQFLSDRRKRIDRAKGGAGGWHPNVQPGAPLPARLTAFLATIQESCGLMPWTETCSQSDKLVIECFPAEAIWAVKRLDQFPQRLTAPVAKAYKEQAGCHLTATQVRELVETTLLEGFKQPSGASELWPRLVEEVISWLLHDQQWKQAAFYRGGKMLDDVVDSMICLATAVSYAQNAAHVWQDPKNTDDGHIIGPGRFLACGSVTGTTS